VAVTEPVCDYLYPGTREGSILVVETPPKRRRNDNQRRAELADFLRNRRASLTPADVGLPNGGRRRTPGLRREEVSSIAGVGTTWYTWLEQGRDVRASLDVLEALAKGLRLTNAERAHLILLGRGEQAPPCKPPVEKVSPALRRLVQNLGPGPAFVLGRRYDLLAWNAATTAVFGDPAQLPKAARNHLWLMFMDPARRELFAGDWERSARIMVAKFRADSARHIGDPAFDELIGALTSASPEFRRLWARHEVAGVGEGRKRFAHPVAGRMTFDHAVFRGVEDPEQRLILYSPSCEDDTAARLAALLEPAEQLAAR
jgi:transcriptional regulator with XRE-family HTH domain